LTDPAGQEEVEWILRIKVAHRKSSGVNGGDAFPIIWIQRDDPEHKSSVAFSLHQTMTTRGSDTLSQFVGKFFANLIGRRYRYVDVSRIRTGRSYY
jgi:hypothetical protein